MGQLTLPASGSVYIDADAVIYSVEKIEPYWTLLQPMWSAARLRAQLGLKTPDAIHAATALATGCALFATNDKGFRRVTGLAVAVLSETVSTPAEGSDM